MNETLNNPKSDGGFVRVEPLVIPVAVLFARTDSVYNQLENVEVYDKTRDARTYGGGVPIVAHPPCRTWGILSHMVKNAPPDEHGLAIWAIQQIRKNGGVLEHPAGSKLWKEMNLPAPGKRDEFGGFTLGVLQWWWGHKAEKKTKLYVCGIEPRNIPRMPIKLGYPEYCVTTSKRKHESKLKRLGRAKDREGTPKQMAEWLVELARRTQQV